jgi:hypothetical protein
MSTASLPASTLCALWASELPNAAVIGKNWIDARDGTGNCRLDNPNDFCPRRDRIGQGKRVIPVLVGEAPHYSMIQKSRKKAMLDSM